MGNRVFVVDACRTPIGKAGGGLSKYTETELLALTVCALMERNTFISIPEEIYVGCCFSQEARNLAKKVAIEAKLPYNIPAASINRTCASSMEALVQGYYRVANGECDVVLVGGTENMSRNPNVMKHSMQSIRKFVREGQPIMPSVMEEQELLDSIGAAVDIMARDKKISKFEQDSYAIDSHEKAEKAWKNGLYNDEVISVSVHGNVTVTKDEGVNVLTCREEYQHAQPLYFRDGSITKYNASPISDGAVAMLLISERAIRRSGLTPLAEVISSALIGGKPSEIGILAAEAYKKLLVRTNLKDSQVGLIECNEAYAGQVLACIRHAKWDTEKLNVHGGSLAIGHPLGCSGLRICTSLIYGMRLYGVEYGVATMCAGGGMGQAVLFRRDVRWD